MKICIDIRPLGSNNFSGVEFYTRNLVEEMLPQDDRNTYIFWQNKFGTSTHDLHFANSSSVHTRVPNRILNTTLILAKRPFVDQLVGGADVLFLPNLNHFSASPNTKVALTVHDLSFIINPNFYNWRRRLWHTSLRIGNAFKRADAIFCVSENTKHDLLELFPFTKNKAVVTPLGVDQQHFANALSTDKIRDARNALLLPSKYILFLSTLEPRKNLLGILEAFALMREDVNLVIVGKPGWNTGKIFKAIQSHPKASRIRYFGYLAESLKPAVIKAASAVLYPSFYEGFGLVVLEAMSVGTPVITSSISSLPALAHDAALLVNPYNSMEIASATDSLLQSPRLSQVLIERGYKLAQKYSWSRTAKITLSVLNQLA